MGEEWEQPVYPDEIKSIIIFKKSDINLSVRTFKW